MCCKVINFVCRKSKRLIGDSRDHKQHEIEQIGDMINGISSLPDCILHHILSFMPTKEVVKTSVLSTRWKNLWASVPNVDFDDALLYASEMDGRRPPKVTSFVKFVYRVLRLRDASNLEKFRLSCRVCFGASIINTWISIAIMHNVRELDLCLLAEDPSVIPQSLFDATSLVSLKIEMNCVLILPSRISFPCLKTLHLSLVTFPNDESTEKLFLGCPVLQELVLIDCDWFNLKNIMISSSTLKKLTIDDLSYYGLLDEHSGCKIKIHTANLTYLEYIGYLSNEIILDNVVSLVDACIHIPKSYRKQKVSECRATDLIKGLRYVASLRVSNRTIEEIDKLVYDVLIKPLVCADTMVNHAPLFPNLIYLVLTVAIGDYTFEILMDLLNVSPTLQSLCLSEGFEICMRLGENNSTWVSKHICMASHLKTLTFRNFRANDSEIWFLECVLKYAPVLEKLDIRWCKIQLLDVKMQRDVMKELESIERFSTDCVIRLS
ncbi:F-box protein At4g22280-like [Rutidosis leptorrhynchoides]|uniref:F-box protein At4g22280-like n=1 Tax=Rutidosis leptorrhynchoides TaxID=125765 RepID=UPI003A99741D